MTGTKVTSHDVDAGHENSITLVDNYVLVTDGACTRRGMQVHHRRDGGQTHVIVVDVPASARVVDRDGVPKQPHGQDGGAG